MRKLIVALTLMTLLGAAGNALANSHTSLVMHAMETAYGPCEIDDPCPDPHVEINIGDQIAAYLVVRNYVEVAGVQTAFEWGSWIFLWGLWDCQANQVSGVTPDAPGGPTSGTIATAFDAITGGASAVVGRMHMVALVPGCIEQVVSSYPFGTHVVDNNANATEVCPDCCGSICAGSAGIDACASCGSVAVESSSWGSIKAQYN